MGKDFWGVCIHGVNCCRWLCGWLWLRRARCHRVVDLLFLVYVKVKCGCRVVVAVEDCCWCLLGLDGVWVVFAHWP